MINIPNILAFTPAQTNSYIRLFHASPNAPAVDIYANNTIIARNLKYKNFTEYFPIPFGRYRLTVFPVGQRQNPVLTKDINIPSQTIATIAVINMVENLDILTIIDPKLPIPPQRAMIRFVHLSPNAPAVDIKVLDGTTLFRDVKYKEIEDYIPVVPEVYNLIATIAGTNDVILNIPNIRLYPGRFYTVYAVGIANGEPPLQVLIPLDGNSYINI